MCSTEHQAVAYLVLQVFGWTVPGLATHIGEVTIPEVLLPGVTLLSIIHSGLWFSS